MKSFVSGIYIHTNSTSGEKICIGLIAVSDGKVYFEKSDKKLTAACALLKEQSSQSVKNSLKSIAAKAEEQNAANASSNLFTENYFDSEHFKHLNTYSQGVIQFHEPKSFAGVIDEKEFGKLFSLFTGETLKQKEGKVKHITIKTQFHQRLKNNELFEKADTDYVVPANRLPSVYAPVKVDMIGENGVILTANALDFTASPENIIEHLQEYTSLIYGIEKLSTQNNLGGSENKLIAEAPDKNTEQYEIYHSIKTDKYSPFKLIKLAEFGSVEATIQKQNFIKFSEFIKTI